MSHSRVTHFEQCPSCAAKGEDNNKDNLAVYDDGHKFCFKEQLYFPPEGKGEFIDLNTFTYEYYPHRGIEKNTLIKYNVLAKINSEGKPVSVGFPYAFGDTKVRNLDKKDFFWSGATNHVDGLFGSDKFSAGENEAIFITEGEYDALTLYQLTGVPAVSVQSSGSGLRDCVSGFSYLNSFNRIVLALDWDAPGREAARKIARLFDPNKVYQLRFDQFKDANEYLQHNEGSALYALWQNCRRYQPEEIKSTFQEFKEILEAEPASSVTYPFPSLNEMLYGIRLGESVLLTAQEGIGKTEFMHALEYHILKESDHDIGIGAIYIEEPKKRHLQAIAGLELKAPVHIPTSGFTNNDILTALEKVVGKDERLHVYSHFGSDDPDSLLDTIRFLVSGRNCRYILLDHLTMVVSGSDGENERRTLDYLSTKLETMVKELNFALIMVSHVNDDGKTRGSRYISKVADIRIDLSRDILSADPSKRNTTEVSVSKNRFSGKTGPCCRIVFDPATFTLSEVENEVWQLPANDNISPIGNTDSEDRRVAA